MDIRNEKIVVVGLGESGVSASIFLNNIGAIVYATDSLDSEVVKKNSDLLKKRYINVEVGAHTEEFMSSSDMFVVSPGVSKDAAPIQFAIKNNIVFNISPVTLDDIFISIITSNKNNNKQWNINNCRHSLESLMTMSTTFSFWNLYL